MCDFYDMNYLSKDLSQIPIPQNCCDKPTNMLGLCRLTELKSK